MTPRILSVCGHSFCHQCVSDLYKEKKVECPLCQTLNPADSISNYTKNLALLSGLGEKSERIHISNDTNNNKDDNEADQNHSKRNESKLKQQQS